MKSRQPSQPTLAISLFALFVLFVFLLLAIAISIQIVRNSMTQSLRSSLARQSYPSDVDGDIFFEADTLFRERFGKADLSTGRSARWLTLDGASVYGMIASPDRSLIAFINDDTISRTVSPSYFDREILDHTLIVMDREGESRRIADKVEAFSFSMDSRYLVAEERRSESPAFIYDIESDRRTDLPFNGQVAFASAAPLIALESTDDDAIYLFDTDGQQLARLDTPGDDVTRFPDAKHFLWIPDATDLLVRNDELDRIERVGLTLEQPVLFAEGIEHLSEWSPDGRLIAGWASDTVAYDGGRAERLSWHDRSGAEVGHYLFPVELMDMGYRFRMLWSPTSEQIAFSPIVKNSAEIEYITERVEIIVLDLTTSELIRVTDNRVTDQLLTWSPDGRYLVFAQDTNPGAMTLGWDSQTGTITRLPLSISNVFSKAIWVGDEE